MAERVPYANRHVRGTAIIAIILLLPVAYILSKWAHQLDFAEIIPPAAFLLTVGLLLRLGFWTVRVMSSRNPRWHLIGVVGKPLLAAVTLGAVFLTAAGMGEGYCFVWPSIDTVYAADCTERKFGQIKVGMTKAEVVARIGQPLHSQRRGKRHPAYAEGDEVWSYTHDGAAPIGDWAWLSRQLIFAEGRVVQKVYLTLYN
jgi:hypothetical protein